MLSDDWYYSSENMTSTSDQRLFALEKMTNNDGNVQSTHSIINNDKNATNIMLHKLSKNVSEISSDMMSELSSDISSSISSNISSDISSNISSNMLSESSYSNALGHEVCKINSPAKCSAKTCGTSNLYPILDPRFNMREVAKQCLLLEDHLNNKQKRCVDCIKKHFLIIDGLLEEAVSLEKDNNQRDYYRDHYVAWINIEKQYAKSSSDSHTMDNVSKQIRMFRKPLVEKYFDLVSEYDT